MPAQVAREKEISATGSAPQIAGTVQELQQTEISETGAAYAHADMSATLTTVRQFNHSEYNESDDRHVDLTFASAGQTATYKTFGAACGL